MVQFQWPWTNHNPVFKVKPFFDAEYLTNGYRYGHSYYRRRIENRTQAFEWYQYLYARFQGHGIIQRQITRKTLEWHKIEL